MLNDQGSNAKEAKDNSVEGQLQTKLEADKSDAYEVVGHAYDGFTTASVLDGDYVGRVLNIDRSYPISAKKAAYLQNRNIDRMSTSYAVNPLQKLKDAIAEHPNAIHYVVISVGGNDFRERLSTPHRLLTDVPEIHKRYLRIVKEVKEINAKNIRPILMFQYPLDANNDHYGVYKRLKGIGAIASAVNAVSVASIAISALLLLARKISLRWGGALSLLGTGLLTLSTKFVPAKVSIDVIKGKNPAMTTLGGLMQNFYRPILAQAKKDNIPILDLPNTFNPHDSLYISGIEPNLKGAELIAEGINHIVKNHNFGSNSMIYSKRAPQSEFSGVENSNPAKWQARILGSN